MPDIYTRSQWGATGRNGLATRTLPVREVYIHHSVTAAPKTNSTVAQDKAHMRTIESIGVNRFGTISYSYVIMPSGRIFRGLTDNRVGAHTGGRNTVSIGVCFAGNYQTLTPTKKQLDNCAALLAYLVGRKSLSKSFVVKGHKDIAATACPGKNLYPKIPAIVTAAKKLIGSSAPFTLTRTLYLRPVLRFRGSDVRRLQTDLTRRGFGGMTINGTFGPSTDSAVKKFQKAKGLEADGIVGKATAEKLGWSYR